MEIGDKVRFLSETGGGIVSGFQGKNIVLVEDEDGFQIPTSITNVVVVNKEDYNLSHTVENVRKRMEEPKEDDDPADRPITFRAPVEERIGGDLLSAYIAFVPVDVKEISLTRFETYLVNDSNYYVQYCYFVSEGSSWMLRSTGEAEPNTKLFIEEFGRDDLNNMEHICVQLIAYKREKSFCLKPVVDVRLRIDTVKFYKLHTFSENIYFEQPALIYTIIENDKPLRPMTVNPEKFKKEFKEKSILDSRQINKSSQIKRQDKNNPVVVDLHAHELLETTAGMSASDILNYQLDTFRNILIRYSKHKGTKIVFIHGKGEGVLRQAIVNELRYKYKNYQYQDASFREYGYGATQVTIK